jgi:hypothetical protein
MPFGPDKYSTIIEVKVKVKVKLFLCLIKLHTMKMYGGMRIYFHTFLFSALDGGEWSALLLGRFTPRDMCGRLGGFRSYK